MQNVQPIVSLNNRHNGIVDWLIANPHASMAECARALGVTEPWLSRIRQSDLFKVLYAKRLAEKRERLDAEIAVELQETARNTLKAVNAKINSGTFTERFLLAATEQILDSIGYSQQPSPAVVQHQHLHVTAEDIRNARERQLSAGGGSPAKIADGEILQPALPNYSDSAA
jgi:hypothetical protein